jgi:hypothetical protein
LNYISSPFLKLLDATIATLGRSGRRALAGAEIISVSIIDAPKMSKDGACPWYLWGHRQMEAKLLQKHLARQM